MHPDTRNIAGSMKDFGLHILGRAIVDATFNEMMKPFAHPLAIVHAAHGAEIVLKARIAQEHPLLIFENLPKSRSTQGDLTITELLDCGRTFVTKICLKRSGPRLAIGCRRRKSSFSLAV